VNGGMLTNLLENNANLDISDINSDSFSVKGANVVDNMLVDVLENNKISGYNKTLDVAENILDSVSTKVRQHSAWMPGDVAHQGDVTLVGLPSLPIKKTTRKDRQIADGDTKGSRHIVEGGEIFDADTTEVAAMISKATKGRVSPGVQYIGPVFSGPCTLTHPQHQHQTFPANCVVVAVYQRNMDAEEREARAKD